MKHSEKALENLRLDIHNLLMHIDQKEDLKPDAVEEFNERFMKISLEFFQEAVHWMQMEYKMEDLTKRIQKLEDRVSSLVN